MWKKDESPEETPSQRDTASRRATRPAPGGASNQQATIGRSIRIRGEVSGDEDLLIQGHVDGTVALKDQTVTVGAEGRVSADITARIVTVEGTVEGDITAGEQVVLRSSAEVVGDITAPRVVLDDGARFRGGVDMGDLNARTDSAKPPTTAAGSSASATSRDAGPSSSSGKSGDTGSHAQARTDEKEAAKKASGS